jgi:hypothetical protein
MSGWRKQQIKENEMIDDPEEEAWKQIEAKTYVIKKEPTIEVIRIGPDGRLFWRGREVETDDDFRGAMMDLAASFRSTRI